MPAYLIARIRVHDAEQYGNYTPLSSAAVEQYGGHFIARGGATETLEGPAFEGRVVIMEFPDLEAARTFYHSPEYEKARAVRKAAAEAEFLVVDGV